MPEFSSEAIAQDAIRAVVRGEFPLSRLANFGIRISRYDEIWEIDNPGNVFLEVTAADVAQGLIQFKSVPTKLQIWASFVLSGSSLIGLDSLNSRPDGDELLGIIWDAAFDGHLSQRGLAMADSILAKANPDGME